LSLLIKPKKAYHNDHSNKSDSFGFIIELQERAGKKYSFGYTGDTQWHPDIIPQYESCNALLVHMGSLINRNNSEKNEKFFKYYKKDAAECFGLVAKKNHPYLPGLLHFLDQFSKLNRKRRLVLVSEFGEELRGGIRRDLNNRLKGVYENLDVLPVDVGLDVLIGATEDLSGGSSHLVMCVQCDKYVDIKHARFETYGHDEALLCVCKTCRKSTPLNVLQERLRRIYEEGMPLRVAT